MILAEKIERKVYVNQEDSVSHIQPPSSHGFLLSFLRELLITITYKYTCMYMYISEKIESHLNRQHHTLFFHSDIQGELKWILFQLPDCMNLNSLNSVTIYCDYIL